MSCYIEGIVRRTHRDLLEWTKVHLNDPDNYRDAERAQT